MSTPFLLDVQRRVHLRRQCFLQRWKVSFFPFTPHIVIAYRLRRPTSAIDTGGRRWNCSPTSDTSCNKGSAIESFYVLACCNRA